MIFLSLYAILKTDNSDLQMNSTENSAGAILVSKYRENKYSVLLGKTQDNKWEIFMGGGIEGSDMGDRTNPFVKAAQRELSEETNKVYEKGNAYLGSKTPHYFHNYHQKGTAIFFVNAKYIPEEILNKTAMNNEHIEFKWIKAKTWIHQSHGLKLRDSTKGMTTSTRFMTALKEFCGIK